jgi:osmotically-inducible protein OsmY
MEKQVMQRMNHMVVTSLAALALAAAAWGDDAKQRSVSTTMDDAAITAGVKTHLIGDADTKAYQINVETRNGVVQLNGFVDSASAKTEAERIASETEGVKEVRNNLEVRPMERSAGVVLDDAAITAKVDAALAADSRTSALRVDVATREGEVQLSGYAKSEAEKQAAEAIAEGVSGVRTVRNDLDVR